ncbi:MAG: site-specific integrase [Paludibacter sp.]|nr:site-specific integrase [Paludibacter sp.]
MKYISIILFKSKSNLLKNGEHPIVLRITKDRVRKYLSLNLSANPNQWNEEFSQFKKDKRINPDYDKSNAYIVNQLTKAKAVIDDFDRNKIDWTLNQFEDAFLNRSKQGKVKHFFENQIRKLKETNHIGNALCYQRTLDMLEIFDKKFDKKLFSEIDIKYVRAFDVFLQMPRESVYTSSKGNKRIVQRKGNSSNSRMIHFRTLRAVLNQAIEAKEASTSTYPFGKGGFEVAKLAEETEKRYLPTEYLLKIKNTSSQRKVNEYARKLFLFSYFCYGISFVDMAYLTPENIKRLENGLYIVYKRHKTKNSKGAKAINIKLTEELQMLINDLCNIKKPVENYLLPIVSVEGLTGEDLYNHLKTRLGKFNKYLDKMAIEFGINDFDLTSYVSRHTMAMSLQNNEIPREVISQILGHKDLKTTNTYLDSFNSNVIDEAVKVL